MGVVVQEGIINSHEYLSVGATLSYAREFAISENQTLRAGISASIKQRPLEQYRIFFPDQIDPRSSNIINAPRVKKTTLSRPDIDLGIIYTNKNLFFSASFHNLINPAYVFVSEQENIPIKALRRINLIAGGKIPLKTFEKESAKNWEISLKPYALLAVQNDFQEAAFGLQNHIGPIMLGYLFKNYGQHVIQGGLQVGPVSFGYAYDFYYAPNPGLAYLSTHELSLQVLIPSKKRSKKNLPMPSF